MFTLFSNIQYKVLTYLQITSLAFFVLLGLHAGLKFSISLIYHCSPFSVNFCKYCLYFVLNILLLLIISGWLQCIIKYVQYFVCCYNKYINYPQKVEVLRLV